MNGREISSSVFGQTRPTRLHLHGFHNIILIDHSLPQLTTPLIPGREEQVEVLEGRPQEEGLHHVPRPGVQRVPHVADGSVPS